MHLSFQSNLFGRESFTENYVESNQGQNSSADVQGYWFGGKAVCCMRCCSFGRIDGKIQGRIWEGG